LASLAAIAAMSSGVPSAPVAEPAQSPSPRRRESLRVSKRYEPKAGNSYVDIAKREQAAAKRARKAARNLAVPA
jgi:hypothetical protein